MLDDQTWALDGDHDKEHFSSFEGLPKRFRKCRKNASLFMMRCQTNLHDLRATMIGNKSSTNDSFPRHSFTLFFSALGPNTGPNTIGLRQCLRQRGITSHKMKAIRKGVSSILIIRMKPKIETRETGISTIACTTVQLFFKKRLVAAVYPVLLDESFRESTGSAVEQKITTAPELSIISWSVFLRSPFLPQKRI